MAHPDEPRRPAAEAAEAGGSSGGTAAWAPCRRYPRFDRVPGRCCPASRPRVAAVPADALTGLPDRWRLLDGIREVAEAVAAAAVTRVPVDGAAVLLMSDPTRWSTAAVTDGVVAAFTGREETVGDGPSVEAYVTGGPVLVPDLAAAAVRWPLLDPGRSEVGAYASLPLRIGAVRFGVLDLYRRTPGRLDGPALATVLRLADLAAVALVQHRGPAERWDAGTDSRPEIDQATGMLSVFLDVDVATAYARLRAHAYGTGRPLVAVAADVIVGNVLLDADGDPDRR